MKKLLNLLELIEESTAMALVGSVIPYDFDIPTDLWLTEADEEQLNRAIHNLIINSLETGPRDSAIHVSARNLMLDQDQARNLALSCGSYVEIIIANSVGRQTAEVVHPMTYKPDIVTVDSNQEITAAYAIIKKHGGQLISYPAPGPANTFYIYLPAASTQLPVEDEVCREIPVTGTGTVLVVDDEAEIRRLLDTVLRRAGYQVEQSSNGEEAVSKYARAKEAGEPYIAVIMDLTMPGSLGGKEAMEQILAQDPSARVIVSSGYSTDPVVYDFARYGFSGAITKPYNIDQLEAELDRVIFTPPCIAGPSEEAFQTPVTTRNILMMEDSNLIRNSISDCLSDLNYTIEFARDGGEALSKYKAALKSGYPFDVVVMDLTIRMGMGGVEAVSRLLKIDPGAKVIITSGYTTEEAMLKPGKYGFKEALAKPFSIDELARALERAINS